MIYSKQDIKAAIKSLGVCSDDSLLIHSSMKSIGHVANGADDVIDAFIEYLSDGLLIFPSHTWSQTNEENPVYDHGNQSSCVGVLTNIFLKRTGVMRSLHPTHSVAAIGLGAKEYIDADKVGNTPCSREGCWGRLYDLDAKIMFLGCSLKRNTIIHGVEEWCNISNRLSETPVPFKVRLSGGEVIDRPCYTHSNPVGDISENYDIIEEALLHKKIAVEGKIGDARTVICHVRKMVDLVSGFLARDSDLFLKSSKVPAEWYKDLQP